jgi:hypothetical protein
MAIRAGEFWVADITFTDRSTSKKRPVLVPWIDGLDAVVAAVTTAAPRTPTDVALAEWAAAGITQSVDRPIVSTRLHGTILADSSPGRRRARRRTEPQKHLGDSGPTAILTVTRYFPFAFFNSPAVRYASAASADFFCPASDAPSA